MGQITNSTMGSPIAIVNHQGRLLVDIGSSINIGSVSAQVDSIYVQSGAMYIQSGTVTVDNLYAGSESWVKEVPKTEVYTSGIVSVSGVVGVEFSNDYVNVIQSGTQWAVSGVVTANTGLYAGSETTILNFGDLGSSRVVIGSVAITGSVQTFGTSITVGSESWIKNFDDLGSSTVVTNFSDLGSTRVVQGNVDVDNLYAGSEYTILNFGDLGSNSVITNFGTLGSSRVIENLGVLGSSRVITNVVGVTPSGTFTVATDNYLGSEVYQGTSPLVVLGSVNIDNATTIGSIGNQIVTGSVNVTNFAQVGSLTTQGVAISGTPEVFVDTRENTSNSYNPDMILVYSGGVIGSIYKNTGTGSIIQVLSYDASDNLTNVSPWGAV